MSLFQKIRGSLLSGVLLTILAVFGSSQSALAQTPSDQFGDWTLQCGEEVADGRNCWLFQRLVNEADNNPIAEIRLTFANGDVTRGVFFMHAPTGILLTARPAYRVDDDATDIPLTWHNCTQRRCTALRPLDASEFGRLRAGGRMAVGYQQLAALQPTVFQVSLVGVTAGFAALGARREANR